MTKAQKQKAARSLFILYGYYKDITWDHITNPRDTSKELNAVYRNELVPTIEGLLKDLKIRVSSRGKNTVKYNPLPFKDLYSIQDEIRTSNISSQDHLAMLSKVQSQTKDILDAQDASDIDVSNLVEEIASKINRMLSPNTHSPTIRAGERLELIKEKKIWWVRKGSVKKMLSKEKNLCGELLNVLFKSWGTERSYEALLADLNARTRKQYDRSQLTNAMKQINKQVSAAGYRRLKLENLGTTFTIGYSDKP